MPANGQMKMAVNPVEMGKGPSYSAHMYKKLSNQDIPAVFRYIANEKEMNLFIEGDIEAYGLESEHVELYAFGDDWDCLLLRYFSNFMVTSNKEYPASLQLVSEFLGQQPMQRLSAKEQLLQQFHPYFPNTKVQGTYLCRLDRSGFKQTGKTDSNVVKLDASFAQEIVDLYKHIEEFAQPYLEHEAEKLSEIRNTYEKGCQGYGIFADGTLVCTASTTANSSSGAMVIGVATHPSYRKRGYASVVVNQLCKACFSDGLSFLCLFYDNPVAGAIYHRLGFETIGRWGMMKF
jgi:hypothetical protein